MLKHYLLTDPLLRDYVDSVYIFEDQPAAKKKPGDIYLPKLEDTDIYIGLFGFRYGNMVPKDELSPTEQEYDAATSGGLTKWIYLIDGEGPIDPRMARLRKKAGGAHTYRHLAKREDLKGEVYASFIDFLRERNELTQESFESVVVPDATLVDDIDHERVRWFVDTAKKERKLAAKVMRDGREAARSSKAPEQEDCRVVPCGDHAVRERPAISLPFSEDQMRLLCGNTISSSVRDAGLRGRSF